MIKLLLLLSTSKIPLFFNAELSAEFVSKLEQAALLVSAVRKSSTLRMHEESTNANGAETSYLSDSQWTASADKFKSQVEDLALNEQGIALFVSQAGADFSLLVAQEAPNGVPQCNVDKNGLLMKVEQSNKVAAASMQTRIKEYANRLLQVQATVRQTVQIRTSMCHHKDAHRIKTSEKHSRFGGSLDQYTFAKNMRDIKDAFDFHRSCECPSVCPSKC